MTSTVRLASLGICMTERKPKPKEIPLTAKRKRKQKVVSYHTDLADLGFLGSFCCCVVSLDSPLLSTPVP